jgi:hypothetical protein
MRPARALGALALALAACGEDAARPARVPASAAAAGGAPPAAAPAAPPEREVLDPSEEPALRAQRLAPRDVPKAVGETAPPFAGLPEKTLAVIVFFRGEW